MIRRMLLVAVCGLLLSSLASSAKAQDRAYGRVWGGQYGRTDWERFYHYPYVWYPQNFWGNEYTYHKSTVSSQALTGFNKLTAPTGVSGHADGTTTIGLSSMHAVRNGPTSDPSHL